MSDLSYLATSALGSSTSSVRGGSKAEVGHRRREPVALRERQRIALFSDNAGNHAKPLLRPIRWRDHRREHILLEVAVWE